MVGGLWDNRSRNGGVGVWGWSINLACVDLVYVDLVYVHSAFTDLVNVDLIWPCRSSLCRSTSLTSVYPYTP